MQSDVAGCGPALAAIRDICPRFCFWEPNWEPNRSSEADSARSSAWSDSAPSPVVVSAHNACSAQEVAAVAVLSTDRPVWSGPQWYRLLVELCGTAAVALGCGQVCLVSPVWEPQPVIVWRAPGLAARGAW
jgi:hypothetical protein